MGYIDEHLMAGEQVNYQGHLSLWSLASGIVIGCIVLAATVALVLVPELGIPENMILPISAIAGLVGMFFILTPIGKYYTTEIAITSKRVIAKTGLFKRDTIEMMNTKVESLQVEQGILGRLFNYGTIVISGAGEFNASIPGISMPMGFRKFYYEELDRNNKMRDIDSGQSLDMRHEHVAKSVS